MTCRDPTRFPKKEITPRGRPRQSASTSKPPKIADIYVMCPFSQPQGCQQVTSSHSRRHTSPLFFSISLNLGTGHQQTSKRLHSTVPPNRHHMALTWFFFFFSFSGHTWPDFTIVPSGSRKMVIWIERRGLKGAKEHLRPWPATPIGFFPSCFVQLRYNCIGIPAHRCSDHRSTTHAGRRLARHVQATLSPPEPCPRDRRFRRGRCEISSVTLSVIGFSDNPPRAMMQPCCIMPADNQLTSSGPNFGTLRQE